MRSLAVLSLVLSLFLLVLGPRARRASASELIDRNPTAVKLGVSRGGVALLSYFVGEGRHYVAVSGAINARPPAPGKRQVSFRVRYMALKPPLKTACGPYDGPPLAFLVTACTARDGSYWAVQVWQRGLPNFGKRPTARQRARELRLSHWRGPLPVLSLAPDWSYDGRFDHVWGRLTYRGRAVHGFRATSSGVPLDTFGRNIYLDTFGSGYGSGWRRENSFLAHRPTGMFCYSFTNARGKGTRYRATVIGPGVTPDISATVAAPGHYDPEIDKMSNLEQAELGDRLCRPN